jgi:hypothetical protein
MFHWQITYVYVNFQSQQIEMLTMGYSFFPQKLTDSIEQNLS